MNAIEVYQLKKSFGDLQAVQGASFSAQAGEVLSLLGPNGAGKSTTISMLSGLLAPSSGEPQRSFKILLVLPPRCVAVACAVTYTACTSCVQAICKTLYWNEASTPSISPRQPVYGTA